MENGDMALTKRQAANRLRGVYDKLLMMSDGEKRGILEQLHAPDGIDANEKANSGDLPELAYLFIWQTLEAYFVGVCPEVFRPRRRGFSRSFCHSAARLAMS